MGLASWAQRRLRDPLLALLRQGLLPDKLALAVAGGIVIGLFPIFGTTTVLCALFALALRTNQAAIQLANYALYPVLPFSILFFFRSGARLFSAPLDVTSIEDLRRLARAGPLQFALALGDAAWRAVLVWVAFALLFAPPLFLLLRRVFRRIDRQTKS